MTDTSVRILAASAQDDATPHPFVMQPMASPSIDYAGRYVADALAIVHWMRTTLPSGTYDRVIAILQNQPVSADLALTMVTAYNARYYPRRPDQWREVPMWNE